MAQGLGFIEFSTGDVLSAAAANGYLASQTVMVFANAAARTSAITTPYEGMFSYLKDTNSTEYYSGSAWVALGGGGASGFVGVSVSSTTDQTVSNATYTALTWDSEYFDTDSFHSNVTNNSRITIPSGKAGKYLVSGYITWDNGTTGSRQLVIRKNGSSTYTQSLTAANFYPTGTVSYTADLAVGDYIEMFVWQSQGASITVYKTSANSSFVMQYLGA